MPMDFENLKRELEIGFNPNKKHRNGENFFHKNITSITPETIELAIEYGFNVNDRDDRGNTIFHKLPLYVGYSTWAFELANKYGLLNAVNNNNDTMLTNLPIAYNTPLFEYYIKVTNQENSSRFILFTEMYEFFKTHDITDEELKPKIDFEKLHELGVDFSIKNNQGKTFVDINPQYTMEIIDLLKKEKNENIRDN